jgi:hypothetical protein
MQIAGRDISFFGTRVTAKFLGYEIRRESYYNREVTAIYASIPTLLTSTLEIILSQSV